MAKEVVTVTKAHLKMDNTVGLRLQGGDTRNRTKVAMRTIVADKEGAHLEVAATAVSAGVTEVTVAGMDRSKGAPVAVAPEAAAPVAAAPVAAAPVAAAPVAAQVVAEAEAEDLAAVCISPAKLGAAVVTLAAHH
jgi:hypothetical protein